MKWYESDNPNKVARGATASAGIWVVVVLGFIALIGAVWWGLSVGTSDVKGQGDAYRAKNDGTNRIVQQQKFEELHQSIQASDRKVGLAAAALASDPSDRTLQTNLSGAQNYCVSVVGEYNALARTYIAADFKNSDLPYKIDDTDPATDCLPPKS